MKAPETPGHVNYYDQLGVPPNASTEQIRDAYRALARMLHPDQQTDPQLKSVAEQQMRKLNPIYTVLADPVRRRQYDEDLADLRVVPAVMEDPGALPNSRALGRLAWAGAIGIGIALLYWLTLGNSAVNPFAGQQDYEPRRVTVVTQSAAGPDQATSAELARLRSEVKTLTAERDFAIHELVRLKGPASAPPVPPVQAPPASPQVATLTELPSSSKPLPGLPVSAPARNDAAPARPTPPAKPTLAGFWFYTKPKDGQKNKDQSLYVPEYIEATITEKNGILSGKYRSRFQISDRAISPEVNFSFSGSGGGSVLTCPFTGQGGSKGEVTLRLTTDNTIRIDWAASELGTQQGLASGTAVLTRRID